jgi:uncharacterized protein (DUF58 family)
MKLKNHLSPDIIAQIKQLEVQTRRLLNGSMSGDSRSAVKGSGLEFDQIREYQQGDDVRFIAWGASARMNKLLIKEYIEERSRTIILTVDVSGSRMFSSSSVLKSDLYAQIASVLALVATYGKDNVALILFSDEIECYIPPARGYFHTRYIMETVFSYQPQRRGTNIGVALEHLAKLKRKDAMAFLISDCIDEGFDRPLARVAAEYDMVAIRCLDKLENDFPSVGFITIEDIETGAHGQIDTRYAGHVHQLLQQRKVDQDQLFKKYGVDVLDINGDRPFIGELIRFFRRRMLY